MKWFTIFAVCLSIIGISFSQIESIRLLGVVLVVLVCYWDLEESLRKIRKEKY